MLLLLLSLLLSLFRNQIRPLTLLGFDLVAGSPDRSAAREGVFASSAQGEAASVGGVDIPLVDDEAVLRALFQPAARDERLDELAELAVPEGALLDLNIVVSAHIASRRICRRELPEQLEVS